MKLIEKLKSGDVWGGAFVAALLAACLYLIQAATGSAPPPPELVGEFVETLQSEIFADSTPGEEVEPTAEASGEGSGGE